MYNYQLRTLLLPQKPHAGLGCMFVSESGSLSVKTKVKPTIIICFFFLDSY